MDSRYAPKEAFFALLLVDPARAALPKPADAGQVPEALTINDGVRSSLSISAHHGRHFRLIVDGVSA